MPVSYTNLKEHTPTSPWERTLFDDNFEELRRLETLTRANEVTEPNQTGFSLIEYSSNFGYLYHGISRHGAWGYIRFGVKANTTKAMGGAGGQVHLLIGKIKGSNTFPAETIPLVSSGGRWARGHITIGGEIWLENVSNNIAPGQEFHFSAFYRRSNMTAPAPPEYKPQPSLFDLEGYNENLQTFDERIAKANGRNSVFDTTPVGTTGLIGAWTSRTELIPTIPSSIVRYGNVCHVFLAFKPKEGVRSNNNGTIDMPSFFSVSEIFNVKYATAMGSASSSKAVTSANFSAEITNDGVYLRNVNRNSTTFDKDTVIQIAGTFLLKDKT